MHPGPTERIVSAAIAILTILSGISDADVFEITNTNDSGTGSFRQAITDANAAAGTDTITFAIPGTGPFTIQPGSALPTITDPVVIDGYSQAGSSLASDRGPATLMIEINGTNAGSVDGLTVTGGNSVIRGLCINRFLGSGIRVESSGGSTIEGNHVGTSIAGDVDQGNGSHGVVTYNSVNNTIGGTTAETRNVVSGNDVSGIYVVGPSCAGNTVQGNYVGTDATGTADLGNGNHGINVNNAPGTTVGGTTPGAGNLVSGNDDRGISIWQAGANGTLVQGNLVGTDATGTAPLGNATSGIRISDADDTVIGGLTSDAGNDVAYNGADGIFVYNCTGNALLSNRIWSNGDLGIDLSPGGVSPNDTGDSDTGSNDLQNYPVLSLAGTNGLVQGSLNSLAGTTFRLQFFFSDTCDPSGYGEGQYLFGDTLVTTDGSGDVTFSFEFDAVISEGAYVTATATDTLLGNTSEFCQRIVAAPLFTVTNTNDSGTGSLRQAITYANASAGTDTITFAIPGTGPFTIQPNSSLPTITDPVVIDGYSQAGSSPASDRGTATLMIELDGTNAGDCNGLRVSAGSTLIRGLCINRFENIGIKLDTAGGNSIQGNHIGTDVSGSSGRGNGTIGIDVRQMSNNTIGGISSSSRNVISDNPTGGIFIVSSSNNVVQGNYIGTDAAGGSTIGSQSVGVTISMGSSNTVGGSDETVRNIISANTNSGIQIFGSGATGNLIQGNYIGTDVGGTIDLGNAFYGILLYGCPGNTIGGDSDETGNLISGNNAYGILLQQTDCVNNTILGNYIGTDITGTSSLGNSSHGIAIMGVSSSGNTLGGEIAGSGNIIAYNGDDGIYIQDGSGYALLSNSIFRNGGLGIDLSPGNVTYNDTGDSDTGTNDLQNFPVLSNALTDETSFARVEGSLNSLANTTFRLQFFCSDTCDPSGYGEGQYLFGDALVTTDGGGDVSFSFDFAAAVPESVFITATATDTALGNTSEFCLAVRAVAPNPFVVTNTGNSGIGSLRWAISNANTIAGTDTITFAIPGTGPFTIQPNSSLPTITDPAVIDGYSQSGSSPAADRGPATLMIELDGSSAGSGARGLRISSGNSTVKGLCINRFNYGIQLETNGGNTIEGNHIGTDPAGDSAAGNVNAVYIQNSSDNTIGGLSAEDRNVISGNTNLSVYIYASGSTGNLVAGNYIGITADGSSALGSFMSGVHIYAASGNTVGGTTADARNIISGSSHNSGVYVGGGDSDGNVVRGNYLGTDVTGTVDLGNANYGVEIFGAINTTVGGAAEGAGNLISGNDSDGIHISGSSGNLILGNSVGTDVTGTAGLPNSGNGITLTNGANANSIGGAIPGQGNIIAANGANGIQIDDSGGSTSNNSILGNYIGTDATGLMNLGNSGSGVYLMRVSDNTIGGIATEEANTIAHNGSHGIYMSDMGFFTSRRNPILSNSLYDNGGLGIDLYPEGTTSNDTGDADSGANDLQNYPVLSGVSTDESSFARAHGSLNSLASTTFRLQFFYSDTCDPSGYGEGQYLFGDTLVTTDGSGDVSFSFDFAAAVPESAFITATATDTTLGNTSEFSQAIVALPPDSFLVTNTNDSGTGSLRQAITDANAAAGTDTITFAIPGTGPFTIQPNSSLPTITDPVVIDGYSQAGSSPASDRGPATLMIEIDGTNEGTDTDGLRIAGGYSTISGICVNRFRNGMILETEGHNTVAGNYIGTDVSGSIDYGNSLRGVYITTSNNTIGGTNAEDRNIISGNESSGINLFYNSDGNVIKGNYIGTDASGTADLGNTSFGIWMQSSNNIIGGSDAGDANIISGNDNGGINAIGSGCTANIIQGNYIGTDGTGSAAIGNTGTGMLIYSSSNNTVGGTVPDSRNIIAFNTYDGISVISATGNRILSNSIWLNDNLGIDLSPDSVTANDSGDADTGANDLQNYPVLSGVSTDESSFARVEGSLNSLTNTTFRLQFFHSDTCDPTGYGEGRYLFGDTLVTTDGSGDVSFSFDFAAAVPESAFVTATATDTLLGNTSEFSQAIMATPPVLILSGQLSGNDLVLEWNTVPPASEYWVYGTFNKPFFQPQIESPFEYRVDVTADTTWSSSAGIADPDTNWTYQVIAVDGSENELTRSNQVGEHEFMIP